MAHVWAYFLELHNRRQIGLDIQPLSFLEIEAWQRLMKISLYPWELRAVLDLDDLFRASRLKTQGDKPT